MAIPSLISNSGGSQNNFDKGETIKYPFFATFFSFCFLFVFLFIIHIFRDSYVWFV